LSRVERFMTQLIMPLYQAPRRNVNTPAPGKKLTGRWYRVKENGDCLKLFYGKNLIWQDTLCIPKRPQPCACISTNNIEN
jgi:hypothetical protein